MQQDLQLRTGTAADYDTLGELIFDAIHHGPTKYTAAQSQAWAPAAKRGPDWAARLDTQHIILAEHRGEIVGFMTIEPGGYIDFAYIRPHAQGSGLFRRLFTAVRAWADARKEPVLSTHASLMAQPAFAAMGFDIDYHESVDVDGQTLPRAYMTKQL